MRTLGPGDQGDTAPGWNNRSQLGAIVFKPWMSK
jgi:hypothetical protein